VASPDFRSVPENHVERIIGKCVDGGLVHHSEVDQQLHFMLWNGLKASLKAISGYKYDTIKDFDGLRVALRQIENYVPQESTFRSVPENHVILGG
jgi:hypothetical protein